MRVEITITASAPDPVRLSDIGELVTHVLSNAPDLEYHEIRLEQQDA